jgi:hypothetical protein
MDRQSLDRSPTQFVRVHVATARRVGISNSVAVAVTVWCEFRATATARSGNWTPSLNQTYENDDDRDHQQEMDQPPAHVKREKAEQPQNEQDHRKCVQHDASRLIGSVANRNLEQASFRGEP